MKNTTTSTTKKSIQTDENSFVKRLSVKEAEKLLSEGIPLDDLPRYKTTIYAGNASFWAVIKMYDSLGKLEKKNGLLIRIA